MNKQRKALERARDWFVLHRPEDPLIAALDDALIRPMTTLPHRVDSGGGSSASIDWTEQNRVIVRGVAWTLRNWILVEDCHPVKMLRPRFTGMGATTTSTKFSPFPP